jgi:D-alanyl-D-alanine carboxypeptidase/D-alanyl-D-alanine-endopeptidase (penicillin-binding protein 4)
MEGGPLQAQAAAILPGAAEGWSVFAWSVERKETLFAINPHEVRIPASNNKVFSAVWAMSVLGPDHRFPTDLLIAGDVQGGVLRGDVVLRGSGDPAFGYPEYEKDRLDPLRAMARQLKARGVTAVEGGVLADATAWDTLNYGPAWPLDTGNGVSAYAPTVSALAYGRNLLWVEVQKDGSLKLEPDAREIPVVRKGGRPMATRKPGSDTVEIRGGYAGPGRRYGVGVAEPALLAAGALRQALAEEGIQVRGAVRRGATPEGASLVHRHLSIPLRQMIPQLNQHSDNFFAEHVWKAAVAKAAGEGSYLKGGHEAGVFFHDRAGVPFGELWQADGSGLSSQNRTSAYALVLALAYAHGQPWSDDFHASMAVGGNSEGTLKRLFRGTAAEGNLHAKTGYINDVRSLSGYVKSRSGETIVFSFLYNGRNTGGARGVQEQLGNLLAEYSR